jgi:multiple sugar transport system permease protein
VTADNAKRIAGQARRALKALERFRYALLNRGAQPGLLQKALACFLLALLGFVFLYPLFHMLMYSLMDAEDLRNPLIVYLPTGLDLTNYAAAAKTLNYFKSLLTSAYVSVIPAVLQSVVACVTAYGLARFEFPGKKIIFALMLATFLIPPTITMLPQFLIYKQLGLVDTPLAFSLPALFGQGLRSALFILVFYQILRTIPRSFEEAAMMDGAGALGRFFKIVLPLAIPGFVISFLFSLVWYWNETTLSAIYFGNELTTLPLQLEKFAMSFSRAYPASSTLRGGKTLNEAVYMAGTLLNILPLLILYFFTQRQFVQSVDKTGITGE